MAGSFTKAFALALALAAPAAAQTVELTPDQTRALAMAAHRAQNPDLAGELARVLIARDPTDSLAHQILAAALYAKGDYAGSAVSARAGFRTARTPQQRYDAAMIVAEARFKQGQTGAARFWLRQAAQVAPTPEMKTNAVRIFQGVGAARKVTTRLDFGIAPNSNINGGASGDTVLIFGIPFTLSGSAQALSGIEARAAFAADWKVSENQTHLTTLGARVTGRTFALSDAAKAKAPGTKGSDFAFRSVEGVLRHVWAQPGATGPTDVALTVGHNWYGGSDLSTYGRLDFGQEWRADANVLRVFGSVERQARFDQTARSATILTAGVGGDRGLGSGDRWQYSFSLRDTRAKAADTDHRAAILSLGYAWAKPVGGASLSARIEAEGRRYDPTLLAPSGREDLRLTGTLSMFFREVDYLGFAPVVDLTASRNASNVSLYDSQDLGISIGFRSTF